MLWIISSLRWSSHLGNEAFFSFSCVFTKWICVKFDGEERELIGFTSQNQVYKCYREIISLFSDSLSPEIHDDIYCTSRNPFTNGLIIHFVISFPCPRICIVVNHELMKPCMPHYTSVPTHCISMPRLEEIILIILPITPFLSSQKISLLFL